MERKGFFARVADLWRGFWGVKVRKAEAKNVEVVYHNAIQKRITQYNELRSAVGRLVGERNRVESQLRTRQEDLALVEEALLEAAKNNSDAQAMALIGKRRALETEMERLEQDHARLKDQAEIAKESVSQVKEAIAKLRTERNEMLARKAMATARLQIKESLERNITSPVSDTALENVREAVEQLENDADLTDPVDARAPGDICIADLREEAQKRKDLDALDELKRRLGTNLLSQGSIIKKTSVEPQKVAEVM